MTNCLVIGAGIVGMTTALKLAENGKNVTILDCKNKGQASNNAGDLNNALESFLKSFNDIGIKIKQTASIYNEAHNKLKTTIKKGEQFAELTAKKTSLSLSEEISENKIKQFDI